MRQLDKHVKDVLIKTWNIHNMIYTCVIKWLYDSWSLHRNWAVYCVLWNCLFLWAPDVFKILMCVCVCGLYGSSRMSASGCMKHSWLNNLEDKAKMYKVRLKSQMRLQGYLTAHRQWKVRCMCLILNGFRTYGIAELYHIYQHNMILFLW